jgi:hypothetical protein
MPILFVHGVAVRSKAVLSEVERYFRQYVEPAMARNGGTVAFESVYWGDIGAAYRWGGICLPRPLVLGMGLEDDTDLAGVAADLRDEEFSNEPGAAEPDLQGVAPSSAPSAHRDVSTTPAIDAAALSDLLAVIVADESTGADAARLAIALDRAVWTTSSADTLGDGYFAALEATAMEELERLERLDEVPVGAGPFERLQKVVEKTRQALLRARELDAAVVARSTRPFRVAATKNVMEFIGDVFIYLKTRDAGAGTSSIMQRVLDGLHRAQTAERTHEAEPFVVLTHSMGGQLMYDAVTVFADRDPRLKDLRIDVWVAAASQIGFFEELALFTASRPDDFGPDRANAVVPKPKRVGVWWNAWDPNDYLSFTTAGIFDDSVVNAPFYSVRNLKAAHGGYLALPRFYQEVAKLVGSRA